MTDRHYSCSGVNLGQVASSGSALFGAASAKPALVPNYTLGNHTSPLELIISASLSLTNLCCISQAVFKTVCLPRVTMTGTNSCD